MIWACLAGTKALLQKDARDLTLGLSHVVGRGGGGGSGKWQGEGTIFPGRYLCSRVQVFHNIHPWYSITFLLQSTHKSLWHQVHLQHGFCFLRGGGGGGWENLKIHVIVIEMYLKFFLNRIFAWFGFWNWPVQSPYNWIVFCLDGLSLMETIFFKVQLSSGRTLGWLFFPQPRWITRLPSLANLTMISGKSGASPKCSICQL